MLNGTLSVQSAAAAHLNTEAAHVHVLMPNLEHAKVMTLIALPVDQAQEDLDQEDQDQVEVQSILEVMFNQPQHQLQHPLQHQLQHLLEEIIEEVSNDNDEISNEKFPNSKFNRS